MNNHPNNMNNHPNNMNNHHDNMNNHPDNMNNHPDNMNNHHNNMNNHPDNMNNHHNNMNNHPDNMNNHHDNNHHDNMNNHINNNHHDNMNNHINNNLIENEAKTNVDKFLQFVNKHKKNYKIPDDLLIKMRTKKIDEIVNIYNCSKKPSKTTINIDDSVYSDFKKSYQKLKQHYLDSTTALLNIMENKLLDKNSDSKTIEYKIKNITHIELNNIQLEIISQLTNYYTKCQTYYEESFSILADSFIPDEIYNNI
jgi:hypothetical protein